MAELLLAGSTSDSLLESLTYSLGPTSEYINARRQTRFHPSGASTYSSNTTQVARIDLKGQGGFLDLSSLKICARLSNGSSTLPLILSGGPHALVSRIRVFCQNSLLEDCSHYSRVHHLFTELLAPSNWRVGSSVESNMKQLVSGSTKDPSIVQVIDPGEYATIIFSPSALGVTNCGKNWPIEMAPLSIEITFATPAEAVISDAGMHPRGSASSTQYVISNLHLQCSQLLVDSALSNSFKSALASGRSLSIALQTVFTSAHVLPSNSTSAQIAMTRALSKLGIVFMSFNDSASATLSDEVVGFANPSAVAAGGDDSIYSHKERTLTAQIQLDSYLHPETAMDSQGEFWCKLTEAAATYDQKMATLSITPAMYASDGFVAAINLMRAPGSSFSGLNTRTGSLLLLKLNNMKTTVTKVYSHLVGTVLVEIRADTCSVYD